MLIRCDFCRSLLEKGEKYYQAAAENKIYMCETCFNDGIEHMLKHSISTPYEEIIDDFILGLRIEWECNKEVCE